MAVITSGNHPRLLWPGVKAILGISYNEIPTQWSQVFKKGDSDKSYEILVEGTGFGLAPVKAEGAAVTYDSHTQQSTTTLTNVTYALGAIVTREEIEDNKYEKFGKARAKALGWSMRQTKEVVGANIFNRAFNSSYLGGDGKELCATDHPSVAGNWSNELNPSADLSEAALESLITQIRQAKNNRGLHIGLQPKKLLVPPEEEFNAERFVNSVLRPGTSNNDVNAIRSMGKLPEGVFCWTFLDQTDDWFILTDCPDGVMMLQRRAYEADKDNDFDTENAKMKATERYVFGWGDPRAVYGSAGA
jgi:hypothetical protein